MFASKDIFLKSSGGYSIARSVRLRSSASAYLNRTPASATNRKTYTLSAWVKKSGQAAYQNFMRAGSTLMRYTNTDTINFEDNGISVFTSAVYRDPAAWYHVVFAIDTTQATSTNRTKIYVNGVQQTLTGTYISQNVDTAIDNTVAHYIGSSTAPSEFFDGYMTEINFIDGQALTPSSFGSTNAITGVWQPAKYTGTYGTNGFYLNFSDNSNNTATTIGKDYSGNGNNWTPNNISVTAGVTYDSMVDSPTVGATSSNYAVLNPIGNPNGPITTYSDGNLTWSNSASSGNAPKMTVIATIGNTSGKWYFEQTVGSNVNQKIGFSSEIVNGTAKGSVYFNYNSGGTVETSSGISVSGTPASYTANDVIGVAFDIGAGTATLYKNNTSQATLSSIPASTWFPYAEANSSGSASNGAFNFGQRPFSYSAPTGFVALNTYNLPASTITNGAAYMAATLYTGTGSSLTVANTVGSASFQPDFVWVKGRSGATDHALYDSVRGTTKDLVSNSTAAETTQATGLTAFGSTGFTVGALAKMNTSSATYVGWQWKAGTTSSSNTNGSITSTVSVGATQGFSVATYTGNGSAGATFGHGLGVTPAMIIIKARTSTSAENWFVYHQNLTAVTYYLRLNSTNAQTDGGSSGATSRVTAISSSVITLGPNSEVNENTKTYVAYCFSAVAGYSAFGSYTGNGSADGPFVFTNFQPRWLMVKRTDTTGAWCVYDTSRNTYNTADLELNPNSSAAENSGNAFDILSNGFKCRDAFGAHNASGGTYVYACFASNPFKQSLAR